MRFALHLLLFVAAAGLGLVTGIRWSKARLAEHRLPPSAHTNALGETATGPSGGTKSRWNLPGPASSPLAVQLGQDLSQSSGVLRWLHWLDALERASLTDFPHLARLAEGDPTAQQLLASRWVELDPRHLFDHLVGTRSFRPMMGGLVDQLAGPQSQQRVLGDVLFRHWTERDPEAVIQALDEIPVRAVNSLWHHQVANGVMRQDMERGLKLVARWKIPGFHPPKQPITDWAAADPRHAAQVVLDHLGPLRGYTSQFSMETVAQVWAEANPAAALEFSRTQTGDLNSLLATTVMKSWGERDPAGASAWLASTDRTTRHRLSPVFVEAWAGQDLAAALDWSQTNLTGSTLTRAVDSLLRGAAAKDPAEAAGLVTAMTPSPERTSAAVVVAEKWFQADGSPQRPSEERLAWLRGLDSVSRSRVIEKSFESWLFRDAPGFARFLEETTDVNLPDPLYASLATEFARRDPQEALAWVDRLQLPGKVSRLVGGQAFAEWRRAQPDPAQEWFRQLPADDERRQPYLRAVVQSLIFDRFGPEQLAAFAPVDPTLVREVVTSVSMTDEQRQRLLAALTPP